MSEYVSCMKCAIEMTGIKSYNTSTGRRHCEKCGGNTTEYHVGNINPAMEGGDD
jgi:hypothetical protein